MYIYNIKIVFRVYEFKEAIEKFITQEFRLAAGKIEGFGEFRTQASIIYH